MRNHGWLLTGLVLLLLSPPLSGAAAEGAETSLVVPEGTLLQVTGPIDVDQLVVHGTLSAPGDLEVVTDRLELGPEALLLAGDAPAAPVVTDLDAVGAPGGDGGSVVLIVGQLVWHATSVVQAGSGGAGGSALGVVSAQGGDGGDGGDVLVTAHSVQGEAALLPGAGGDGGSATVPGLGDAPGSAQGGAGGDSGSATLNDVLVHSTGGMPSLDTESGSPMALDHCALGHFDNVGLPPLADTACALLEGDALELDLSDPCGPLAWNAVDGGIAEACSDALARAFGLPGWMKDRIHHVLRDPPGCEDLRIDMAEGDPCGVDPVDTAHWAAGLVLGTLAGVLESCGIRTYWAASGSTDLVSGRGTCKMVVAGVMGDIKSLPEWLASGAPGLPGLVAVGCADPKGKDGEPNPQGTGGAGGDACVDNSGGNGKSGKKGSSGFINCRDGGPGGIGGNAAASTATGGNGGFGSHKGGGGGSAGAYSNGGDGGDGGSGGTRTIGSNCKGGDAGHGGNAAGSTANGGKGGDSVCGVGGSGGDADAESRGGLSGTAGSGNPSGAPGKGGESAAATAKGGEEGLGPGAC